MLVGNYPDAHERAVADGADPEVGEAALDAPAMIERVAEYLPQIAKQTAPR